LVYAPGSSPINEDEITSHYSNLAYGLAGIILERNLQKSLETIFKEYILSKINMNNTSFDDNVFIQNRAEPHNLLGITSFWDMAGFNGAGGLNSNLNDLVLFTKTILFKSNDIELDNAINESVNPTVMLNSFPVFGLGWEFYTMNNGNKILVKDGGTGGFTSFVVINRENKKGIVALFNNNTDSNQAECIISLINLFIK